MKHLSNELKRMLSMLLAFSMVFGIVAMPGNLLETSANSGGAPVNVLSTPIYSNTLDDAEDLNEDNAESTRPGNVSGHSENLPLGWTFKNNNSRASSLKEGNGGYYWQMKTAQNRNSATFASYQFQSENNKNVVLSYDFMTDCADDTYVVQLPILATGASARTMDLRIDSNVLYFDGTNYSKTLTKGEWYHVDIVCVGSSNNTVKIYIDNVLEYTKTNHYGLRNATALYYLNMSLGNGAHKGTVTMNLDNLAVYNYIAAATFGYAQTEYQVAIDSKVTPAWQIAPANAYIPSVTYTSSNDLVATVNPLTGEVTGRAEGTVTITAKPAAATGLPAVTTTVEVKKASDMIAVTGVTINGGQDSALVSVGKQLVLTAALTPVEATGKTIKWSTDDASVASVNANTGVVTGNKSGTAVITATVDGTTVSDTITVTVIAGMDKDRECLPVRRYL